MNPTKAYETFEKELLERLKLPANQPEFIALLEEKDIISEKTKKNLDMPNQIEGVHAVYILEEIQESLSVSDKKFNDLLSVMIDCKNGLETLAQKIKNHLDPSMCLYIHIVYSVHI